MNLFTHIDFVRHGHVDNPKDIVYGLSYDLPLSAEGKCQARSAGYALRDKPLAAIFCSPLRRARQTANAIRRWHSHLEVRISPLINEVHIPCDGLPIHELEAHNWVGLYPGLDPQYEQLMDVPRGALKFVDEVCREYPGQHVVAVTHGDVIVSMILWAKRMPIAPEQKRKLSLLGVAEGYPATASISKFVYQVHSKNEVLSFEYLNPNAGDFRSCVELVQSNN